MIVVNIQGDLPTIARRGARRLVPLADRRSTIATLAAEIREPEERTTPTS